MFYDYIYNHTPDKTHITDNVDNYVDVRSIAELHWLALTKAEGCGRRFIGSIGPVCMQDVSVVLNKHDSSLKLPKGKPGGEKEADSPENAIVVDGGRAVRLLGLRHISLKQSLIDMYEEFESRRADWGIKDSLSATRDLPFTAPRSLYEVPQVAFEANGPVDRTADKGCWANLSSTIGEVASSFRYCLFGQDIKLEDIDQEEAMGEKQAFAII